MHPDLMEQLALAKMQQMLALAEGRRLVTAGQGRAAESRWASAVRVGLAGQALRLARALDRDGAVVPCVPTASAMPAGTS